MGEEDDQKKINLEGFAASVELPEGHQLVIGELPPGTVVEVATWQGTGRPDETTNRFLLSASGSGLQRRQRTQEKSEITESQKSAIEAPRARSHPSQGSVGANAGYLGMKTFGVDHEEEQVMPSNPKWRAISRSVVSAIAVLAVVSVVLSLLGISVVVPTRGAKTSLGPSTIALVIYKKTPSVSLGSPTVARITVNGNTKFIFGPSNSFDANTIQIQTTAGQELVASNAIAGRAFLAIPGIGILFKPFLG